MKPPANQVKDRTVRVHIPKTNLSVCRSMSESAPLHVAHFHSVGLMISNGSTAGRSMSNVSHTISWYIWLSDIHAEPECIKGSEATWLGYRCYLLRGIMDDQSICFGDQIALPFGVFLSVPDDSCRRFICDISGNGVCRLIGGAGNQDVDCFGRDHQGSVIPHK